jgi:CubicO group peptidase (beta-lactamase class C family)
MTRIVVGVIVCASLGASWQRGAARGPAHNDAALAARLEPIRVKHGFPALGGAIVTSDGLQQMAVTGVRKAGTTVDAAPGDLWHLGSDTKAMTAVVIAKLVEQHKLTWQTTIGEVLPKQVAAGSEAFRGITLLQLLSHRAGLVPNIDWGRASKAAANPRSQRFEALPTIAKTPLSSPPGTKYEYSNLGYVVAATMAERAADRAWEDMIHDVVFAPLGMTSCGFGGVGTPGRLDQPWPHGADGKPMPANGPDVDNPEVMGPAGTVHCSLADWAKFVADQLRGLNGTDGVLKAATYAAMHAPPFGGDYAAGWLVTSRPWGGGTVYTHNGSNTMNYATVWMAPARDFAVLVVTNRGGDEAAQVDDEAASALILMHAGGGLP